MQIKFLQVGTITEHYQNKIILNANKNYQSNTKKNNWAEFLASFSLLL